MKIINLLLGQGSLIAEECIFITSILALLSSGASLCPILLKKISVDSNGVIPNWLGLGKFCEA